MSYVEIPARSVGARARGSVSILKSSLLPLKHLSRFTKFTNQNLAAFDHCFVVSYVIDKPNNL